MRLNKKEILAGILNNSALLTMLFKLLVKNNVRILAYHRVIDIESESEYGADLELISASTDEFDWQMQYVKKKYNVIAFSQLLDALEKKSKIPHNSVVITFDDGFDDNYTNAFPILKKYELPALFFIATGYMGLNKTFWFDWVVYLIKQLDMNEISLDNGLLRLQLNNNRQEVAEEILKYMKLVADDKRRALVNEIEMLAGHDADDGCPYSRPLTWGQVKEMSDAGMEFGSHSVSHPILTRLNENALITEMSDSKKMIENRLGLACYAVAYPVGGALEYNEKVIDVAKRSGYKMAVTYQHGACHLNNFDRYNIKRLHVERYTSRNYFSSMLMAPGLL